MNTDANPSYCSTGSIISTELSASEEKLKQLDLIIWSPTPLPAIFDSAGFSLVPEQSVHGVIEIKRSAYTNVGKSIKQTLDWVESHVYGEMNVKNENIIKLIQNNDLASLQGKSINDLFNPDTHHIALGVICIKEYGQNDSELDELIDRGRAIVLQEFTKDGAIKVNVSHVLHLIEFIKQVRIRGSKKLISSGINTGSIGMNLDEHSPGDLRK